MGTRDVIVVGASAGGVEALRALVAGLPADLPAAVLVALHVPALGPSALPTILARSGPLPARHAVHGEPLRSGQIYVAPPDRHLAVGVDRVLVTRGPRVNGHRPAVDALFLSAAREVGARGMGVVLSGALDDGAAGLLALHDAGGLAFVQSPGEALFPGMPESVLRVLVPDLVAPVAELAAELARRAGEPVETPAKPATRGGRSPAEPLALAEPPGTCPDELAGPPSGLSCPECRGALWRVKQGPLERFCCPLGHGYGLASLLGAQDERLEQAIWVACRALHERAAFATVLADRSLSRGESGDAAAFGLRARTARAQLHAVRAVLEDVDTTGSA